LQDDAQAVRWYTAAAAKGITNVYRALADCYAQGKGVEKNPAEAAKLYEQVISADDAEGQYMLACCYEEAGDTAAGMICTERAAELGHEEARSKIALKAFDKAQKTRNFGEAYRLLMEASELGDAAVAARIAYCCEYGLGTEVDKLRAEEWSAKSHKSGGESAELPKLVTTQSQGTFTLSGPLSVLPAVYQLPSEITEKAKEDDTIVNVYHRNKTATPVQYDYQLTFYEEQGDRKYSEDGFIDEKIIAVTDDFITTRHAIGTLTYRDPIWDSRPDFWDSRTLRYCFSTVTNINEDCDAYQYDQEKGRLLLLQRTFSSQIGYTGTVVEAFDVNLMQGIRTSLSENLNEDNWGEREENIPFPTEIFTDNRFSHLTNLSPAIEYQSHFMTHHENTALIYDVPVLQTITNKGGINKGTLSIHDIDLDRLRINRQFTSKKRNQERREFVSVKKNFSYIKYVFKGILFYKRC
jgi:TPR repeat protein